MAQKGGSWSKIYVSASLLTCSVKQPKQKSQRCFSILGGSESIEKSSLFSKQNNFCEVFNIFNQNRRICTLTFSTMCMYTLHDIHTMSVAM